MPCLRRLARASSLPGRSNSSTVGLRDSDTRCSLCPGARRGGVRGWSRFDLSLNHWGGPLERVLPMTEDKRQAVSNEGTFHSSISSHGSRLIVRMSVPMAGSSPSAGWADSSISTRAQGRLSVASIWTCRPRIRGGSSYPACSMMDDTSWPPPSRSPTRSGQRMMTSGSTTARSSAAADWVDDRLAL